uniref:Ankyrin repeat domain 65 n=1 Tax=Pseudonaja textilis TaxID=8673 RepID=A0A670YXA1_PSETE
MGVRRGVGGRGAMIHTDNRAGYTPLHHAAWSGHTQVADLLLARGALAMGTTQGGLTPFHCAAANGHTLMMQLLLRHGADPNAGDCNQWTSLHWATAGRQLHIIVKLLLQNQADGNLADSRGCTPLHKAAAAGSLPSVYLLLQGSSPASVTRRDGLLLTPLHHAVLCGHADVAGCLLAHGADVNAAGWLGKTALHLAAEMKSIPLMELLIANGADLSQKTWWKETAEDLALVKKPETRIFSSCALPGCQQMCRYGSLHLISEEPSC